MNPELQRIAIAEACGWKWTGNPHFQSKEEPGFWWNTITGIHTKYIPDYLNDLNAMHMAVTTWIEEAQSPYEKSEREYRFADELNKVILGKKNGYVRSGYITSAEDQAEAFLLAIEKNWQSSIKTKIPTHPAVTAQAKGY